MDCTIEWNALTLPQWEERFTRAARPSLLQSYDYARAACRLYHQRARWGLIRIQGEEAGLVQVLEAGFGPLHGMALDCGPVWLPGFGAAAHSEAFFRELAHQFPRRLGRCRRIIPNLPESPENLVILENLGYKRLSRPGYRTIWIDLEAGDDALLAAMKPQWRNKLRKAEKAGLTAEWDERGAFFPALLTKYQSDRVIKGYDGPSVRFLRALAGGFAGTGRMIIGRAMRNNEALAMVLLFLHGAAATYQVGWSSAEGRESAAHNFLLWRAVPVLKGKQIRSFDLGGINDGSAKGVGEFKRGMGGEAVTLAGHYT